MLTSSVGKKIVAGATGLLLAGFVVLHMAGHLLVFQGRPAYNAYAEKLQSLGPLKWAARGALLAIAAAHVYCTLTLALANRAARPVAYQRSTPRRSTWASRWMAVSGLTVLAFLVFHLLHFTVMAIDGSYADLREKTAEGLRHDTFGMMAKAFSSEWLLLLYLVGMVLLFGHLAHGLSSLLHTLGLTNRRLAPWQQKAGQALAGIIVAGFVIVPLFLYFKSFGNPPVAGTAATAAKDAASP